VYMGGAGMIWALDRLGSSLDLHAAIAAALQRYRTAPATEASTHAPSVLVGETGILLVAQTLSPPPPRQRPPPELVRGHRAREARELLAGWPGRMRAARACGLETAWRESAALLYEHWDPESDMWTHHLEGRLSPYIGAGHGFASNVHALRGFVDDD